MPTLVFKNEAGKILYKVTVRSFIPVMPGQEKKIALALMPLYLNQPLKNAMHNVEVWGLTPEFLNLSRSEVLSASSS